MTIKILRNRLSLIALLSLLCPQLHAQDCALPLSGSDPATKYEKLENGVSEYAKKELNILALAHGLTVKNLIKNIHSGVLLSSWDLGLEGGKFGGQEPAPLKSVFTMAMQTPEKIIDHHYSEEPANGEPSKVYFEAVLLFKPEIMSRYPIYANLGWNYDRYMKCISADANKKIASLKRLITPQDANVPAIFHEHNEVSFLEPLGVSLSHLMGIHVHDKRNIPAVEKALREKGLDSEIIEKLLDWRSGGYQGEALISQFPVHNATPEQVNAIYESNRIPKDKVLWQDFTRLGREDLVTQMYAEFTTDTERLAYLGKLLEEKKELLITVLFRKYRMHVRITGISADGGLPTVEIVDLERLRTHGEQAAKSKVDLQDIATVGDVTALDLRPSND